MHEGVQERPWGSWEIINHDPVVKVLRINPGAMLSLQYHFARSEKWYVASGTVIAYSGGYAGSDTLEAHASIMPADSWRVISPTEIHRLINPSNEVAVVIETITGDYDENDIVRLHDNYGR